MFRFGLSAGRRPLSGGRYALLVNVSVVWLRQTQSTTSAEKHVADRKRRNLTHGVIAIVSKMDQSSPPVLGKD